jgi:hypothetical protein
MELGKTSIGDFFQGLATGRGYTVSETGSARPEEEAVRPIDKKVSGHGSIFPWKIMGDKENIFLKKQFWVIQNV